jgi:hypothetical protein
VTVTDDQVRDFVTYLEAHACGAAKAITAKKLCVPLGLPATHSGARTLRACAHAAIENGTLVCATGRGYFIPASLAEAEETAARLKSEANELHQRARLTLQLARERYSLTPPAPSADDFLAALRG